MGGLTEGSVGTAVARNRKDHPSKIRWSAPSGANHELNFPRFRTEAVVVDEGDVAVYAVKGSLYDASAASGVNHQNPGGDH